jgi:hypothetical protein
MRSHVASHTTLVALALSPAAIAFFVGARVAGALNGRALAVSVARVPMPLIAQPPTSPVHTHVH